jgi:hypothetical protein
MWNSMKSVKLSLVCTRLVAALVLIAAAVVSTEWGRARLLQAFSGMPELWASGTSASAYLPAALAIGAPDPNLLLFLCYACCVPALAALFFLDRLLVSIARGEVFTAKNVRALRVISWCCFGEALILAAAAWNFALLLFALSVAAAFIGLILRVVKNVIDAAVLIKTENDLTI